ncbi:TRAP transporter small permease subunit [Aminobacter sp. MDW-2]|nr:TRAP transporter small permease subunit [Aminobacter sp. MDW-2]
MTPVAPAQLDHGEMDELPAFRNKLVAALNWMLETLAMLVMAGLASLVFLNAFSRYALSTPLPWAEEIAINLMVWLTALGIMMAGMRQSLICCDIVTGRLSTGRLRLVAGFCAVLGSAAMFYCAWLAWQYLMIFGSDASPVLRLPKGIVIAGLFFALLGLATTLLVPLFKRK